MHSENALDDMIALLATTEDPASLNIKAKLLRAMPWTEGEEFEARPIYQLGDVVMATYDAPHLFVEDIDARLEDALGQRLETVIFLSRHKSKSGARSLTVHPIGNFARAELGGRDRTLVPAAPRLMCDALRMLKREAEGLDYLVCFEVTHHGPYLSVPAFFIEIGSDESAWRDDAAGTVVANTLLRLLDARDGSKDYPVLVGVGGGHYAPRLTDVALARKTAFAHMIPNYQLGNIDDRLIDHLLEVARPTCVYFHRKGLKKSQYREFKQIFEAKGIAAVRADGLEPF